MRQTGLLTADEAAGGPATAAAAPPEPAVVTGVVERVLLHRAESGYTVLRLKVGEDWVVVVGEMPSAEPGELLRAQGHWIQDRVWGRQFRAKDVQLEQPASEEGLVAYLTAMRVKGVAEAGARRLVRHFGMELPQVIENTPERIAEIRGVGPKLVQRLTEAWREQRRGRDMLLFLASHGVGAARAARILETFGAETREKVMGDPYVLAREVKGIGFRTADEIALRLGLAPDAPQRLGAAVGEVLREAAGEGHTALPRGEVLERLGRLVPGAADGAAEAAVGCEVGHRRVAAREADGDTFLATRELDRAEGRIASCLAALAQGEPPWSGTAEPEAALARAEAALGVSLAPTQAEAVRRALVSKLLIVTGGPGTGKTTIVRGILEALGDRPRVLLAAPTGRAARRLAESTGREARTLHRLLEADPERGFRRHAGRRLEGDLLVVDEASMVDTGLMAALLEALPPEAGLILVGDADQLPSVGPGQVLADLIAAGTVPVLRLTEVFRQAAESGIVRSAHRINRGEAPDFARGDESSLGDFYGIRVDGPEDAEAKLLDLLTHRIPGRFGLDPVADVQVITPVHRGPLGTRALNLLLQRHLNPEPGRALVRGEARFAPGDKVMQLENDYEREVYNGDVGRVARVDPEKGSVEAMIDGRPLRYAGEELDRLAPAYAVTVHKAQGSEYPAVVVPLLRQHGRMLRRNLLYTAITRARRLVVLLAEPAALERAVRDAGDQRRGTLLRHRLAGAEWVA